MAPSISARGVDSHASPSTAASAEGSEELTTPDPERETHFWPEILPGGDAVLFTIWSGSFESAQIAVLSLKTRQIKSLVPEGSNPRYVSSGHIVYGTRGTLRAIAFDLDELEVTSDPVTVLDGVVTKDTGAAGFAVADDGSLGTSKALPVACFLAPWCGSIAKDEKRRWPPRPARTSILGSRPMAMGWLSTSESKGGVSGSGTWRARP